MTGWIRRAEALSAARAEPMPPRAPNDGHGTTIQRTAASGPNTLRDKVAITGQPVMAASEQPPHWGAGWVQRPMSIPRSGPCSIPGRSPGS
jgi:hypothetical protein